MKSKSIPSIKHQFCGINFKSPNHKITKSPNSRYTLIEILMVIVIMALLMAAAMPAFTDMMKGQGVESSARNICQTLKLARSYAINNREYVALLMPQSNKNVAAYPASGIPTNYYDRSYRVCIVQKNASGGYDFKRWLLGEGWEFISTGVAIFETDTDNGTQFTSGKPTNDNTCTLIDKVNFDDIQSGSTSIDDVAGIVFKPTGKSIHVGNSGSAGTAGAKEDGYYIEIGEGTYSGSELIVTNQNASSVVSIKVADFTGRVTYGTD